MFNWLVVFAAMMLCVAAGANAASQPTLVDETTKRACGSGETANICPRNSAPTADGTVTLTPVCRTSGKYIGWYLWQVTVLCP